MKLQWEYVPEPCWKATGKTQKWAISVNCEGLFEVSDDESESSSILAGPKFSTLEDAKDFVAKRTEDIKNNKSLYWSITIKGNTKMIGSICLWNFSTDRKVAEVGYDLNPIFHNQGIMSEALQCILNFGFNTLYLNEIEAFTHRLNEPSKRLLIKHNFVLQADRIDEDNLDNLIFTINRTRF